MIIPAIRSLYLHWNFDQVGIMAPADRDMNMLSDGIQTHNTNAAHSKVMV